MKYSFSSCIRRRGGRAQGHSCCSNRNCHRTSAFVTAGPLPLRSTRKLSPRPMPNPSCVPLVGGGCPRREVFVARPPLSIVSNAGAKSASNAARQTITEASAPVGHTTTHLPLPAALVQQDFDGRSICCRGSVSLRLPAPDDWNASWASRAGSSSQQAMPFGVSTWGEETLMVYVLDFSCSNSSPAAESLFTMYTREDDCGPAPTALVEVGPTMWSLFSAPDPSACPRSVTPPIDDAMKASAEGNTSVFQYLGGFAFFPGHLDTRTADSGQILLNPMLVSVRVHTVQSSRDEYRWSARMRLLPKNLALDGTNLCGVECCMESSV